MSHEAARKGVLTSQVIADCVPWDKIEKVLVVYMDEHGSICFMASEEAYDGYFMALAELQVSNATLLKVLKQRPPRA